MKSKFFFTLLVVFIMNQGCSGTASPTPPATNSRQAIQTQQPLNLIEPLVASPRLRFDSWSPDSQWFAYWFADGEDLPARLAFVDVQSHKICQHEEISVAGIENGGVKWADDGQVNVNDYSGKKTFRGTPCEKFSEIDFVPPSFEMSFLSPDGRHRADTIISGSEGELSEMVTTITEIVVGKIVSTLNWGSGPHTWAESGWLNNKLYLVGFDVVKQEALYVSLPDGKVGNIVTDLLGLEINDIGDILRVGREANMTGGQYHLLIERYKDSPAPLLLYHSELDLVEELPFYRSWLAGGRTFSPGGKWLFPFHPTSRQDATDELWIRSVDPPGGEARQLADGSGFAGFSLSGDGSKIAVMGYAYVDISTFPGGDMIGQWGASGYDLNSIWWSPDGTRLAVYGFPLGSKPEAIFVIEP